MYNIGVIGLGRMGQAICLRILESDIALHIYNRTQTKAVALRGKGAVLCESPAALCSRCSIIILCLAGEQATKTLLSDKDHGLLHHCRPGSIIIDIGTISPLSALNNNQLAEAKEVGYVSCPVSGGAEGAHTGTLSAIVACRAVLHSKIEPVVSLFANQIIWLTNHAEAQKLKIINNLAESINLLGAFEVLNIGLEQGITLDNLQSVLTTCRGRSAYMDVALRFLSNAQLPSDVSLAVRCKDLFLAGGMADISCRYAISDTAIRLFNRVREKFGDEQDQCDYFNFINS